MKTISVSKVLEKTRPFKEQERLELWKARVGPAEAKEIQQKAFARGRVLDIDFKVYTEVGSCYRKGLNNYLSRYYINHRELPVEHEVFNGLILKGRIDGLLTDKETEESLIMDLKTSSKPKEERYLNDYFLQLGAYYYLLQLIEPNNSFRQGRIVCFVDGIEEPQIFRLNEKQLKGYAEQFIKRLGQYIDECL